MTKIIDGRARAERLRESIQERLKSADFIPCLHVILVGDNPASRVYVEAKSVAAKAVGIDSIQHTLPRDTSETDLLILIGTLNNDPSCNGILIQLPLPQHINPAVIIQALDPLKDVDGLHPHNTGRLWQDLPGLKPCTPLGVMDLIQGVTSVAGKHAVVVGRSHLVGRPLAGLLLNGDATVTMAHIYTKNLPDVCKQADILVIAIGDPRFIQGAWIKPGAIVIDVGITRGEAGLLGDVDFESAQGIASYITPVPGGVGPMTVAYLLYNTVYATCLQKNLDLRAYLP